MNTLDRATDDAVRTRCITELVLHGWCASAYVNVKIEDTWIRKLDYVKANPHDYEEVSWARVPTRYLLSSCAYLMRTLQGEAK